MNGKGKTNQKAFTLIELTVVVCVILLALAIALPTMITFFKAGADKQAENVFSALCTAARARAVMNRSYVVVHGQLSVGAQTNAFYVCVFDGTPPITGSTSTWTFWPAPGYYPQRLPGDMCLGAVNNTTVNANVFQSTVSNPAQLMCFSIIFSPSGRVVTQVDGTSNVIFNPSPTIDLAFYSTDPNTLLWDSNWVSGSNTQPGVTAVTLFPYTQYAANQSSPSNLLNYLNNNGQFLPLNVYTGQIYPRK